MQFEKRADHQENLQLKVVLKTLSSKSIDQIVHQIAKEETAKIDCTLCGNCCKNLHPAVTDDDAKNLADFYNTNIENIFLNFTNYDDEKKMNYMKNAPCSFLCENKCTVYNARPASCIDYPHLHQAHFKYRLKQVFDNYNICPIIYNTIEGLKKTLGIC